MPILCGTDIIEIRRIKSSIQSIGDAFIKKVYTENEVLYCEKKGRNRFQSYAARFAAKEAVAKAFGTGIGKEASFHEIEILNNELGCPYVVLRGSTKAFFERMNFKSISLSISHCEDYAIAYVIIDKE